MLPSHTVAQHARWAALAVLLAVGVGSASIADTGVLLANRAPAGITSAQAVAHVDSNDPDRDPEPLIQDPPEVQSPPSPGQKTLTPQHRRSRHRAPTST